VVPHDVARVGDGVDVELEVAVALPGAAREQTAGGDTGNRCSGEHGRHREVSSRVALRAHGAPPSVAMVESSEEIATGSTVRRVATSA
jgi:hypothetical protein